MRLALGVGTLSGVGLLGTLGAGAANAAPIGNYSPGNSNPVVGHVYLDDNTAGTNSISGFDRHVDGSLTPLAGSPFTAGGAGTGAGLASQGAIQVSSDGRFLLAVDAGSNQVSILRTEPDGALQLNQVVSSNGPTPVSIAVHDNLVYVANAGAVGPNYTGFVLNPFGQIQPLAHSTVSLPNGSQPGDVLFNSTGTSLVGTRVGPSEIDSFVVGRDGLLSAAPGSPSPAQGLGPFGSEFRPTNPQQLFVSNAHNVGAGTGTISAFNVTYNGSLKSIGTSPFADDQTAPCWIEITHNGQFLFTVNTASGEISRYAIAPNGTLTLLGSTPVSNSGGAVDARLSNDGRTLYVDESKAGTVAAFAVSGGNLTELPSSPVALPVGAHAAGIVTTGN
ncbi:MAG TPA: beta-propeller fold lactonase family protein [Acidimicrobiales bacterium]